MATETNAEQLARIRDTHRRRVRLPNETIDWLIEQAERVQEWEASNARISKIALNRQKYIDQLVDENARLREALVELSQGKFDCYEDDCANFALSVLAGDPNGQR